MKTWLVISVLLCVLALASSLVVWNNREDWLPEKVPTHWNASGEPDAFTARDSMLVPLLIMPGTMVLMIGLGLALPWLSPEKFKIEPFQGTYEYIMALIQVMFGYLHVVILLLYLGKIHDATTWIGCGTMLGIAAMGNVLGKVKRNFYVGVRTPWTLASETVWNRTHRLAAWLFVVGGVGGSLLILLQVNFWIAFSLFIGCALFPVLYSLLLYKSLERQGKLVDEAPLK